MVSFRMAYTGTSACRACMVPFCESTAFHSRSSTRKTEISAGLPTRMKPSSALRPRSLAAFTVAISTTWLR